MSFGFGKKKGGKNRTPDSPDATDTRDKLDKNGSTEELYTGSPVMSGRSTPLARPRKETAGLPLRTNRFGFRQTAIPKTAKVADINMSAEQALSQNFRDQDPKNNNYSSDKHSTKPSNGAPIGLIPMQVGGTGLTNISTVPRQTKQTVILTYSAKQYPVVCNNGGLRSKSPAIPNRVTSHANAAYPRSVSASRAYSTGAGEYNASGYRTAGLGAKYAMQTYQLPKPQYPAVKLFDSKSAKQVANNSRKIYGSSDGSSKEGSVTEDSGVSGVEVDGSVAGGMGDERGDGGDWSPRASRRMHRRPRTLQMVMRGEHNFHLRELQVNDLDIMVDDLLDEALVTDVDVIPLPKLPSTFDRDKKAEMAYDNYQSSLSRFAMPPTLMNTSTNSTSERFTTRFGNNQQRDRSRFFDPPDNGGEEKVSRDRIQRENMEKQDFMKLSSNSTNQSSSLTRNSSKESTPSTKSDESHQSTVSSRSDPLEAWVNQTAGESMALRSNDDISVALSLSSSCDEEKRVNNKSSNISSFTPTTVDVVNNDEPRDYAKLTSHPMMMKSLTLSQHSAIQSILMSTSMSSSAYSDSHNSTLMDDPNLALAALASSNQSLIDDETSPADSLISSSTDSNNDMPVVEKDPTMSSSAYHTADNDKDIAEEDICIANGSVKDHSSEKLTPDNNKGPNSPGTPTNASNSLSLSEGRDFLIDDEIADQPALMFETNSTAEAATSSLQLLHVNITDNTPTLRDPSNTSSMNKFKAGHQHHSQKTTSTPPRPHRSPSLDTLSPCDSIASDDLIMDVELNHSITSLNSLDEYIDRLDGSIRSGLNSLEDAQLREELMKLSIRKHTNAFNGDHSFLGNHAKHHQSNSTSNSSIANVGATLPARTARLLGRSRACTPDTPRSIPQQSNASPSSCQQSPSSQPPNNDETSLRLERATHGSMQQDIVTIKTMLLKLKRVLQETETLNPLDIQRDSSPLKNGPSLRLGSEGEASPPPPSPKPHEEVADLRRQLVFLQSQLEERERMVKLLQQQMSKFSENSANGGADQGRLNGVGLGNEDMCNVATQTERLRPVSQGSNLLQGLHSESHTGGIVSWNEQKIPRRIVSPCEFYQPSGCSTPQSNRHQVFILCNSQSAADCDSAFLNHNNNNKLSAKTNGHALNGTAKQESPPVSNSATDNSVSIKNNCRVGSRYLQAIASKQTGNSKFVQNGMGHNERASRSRSLYNSRSKSIENFEHHNGCNGVPKNGLKLAYSKQEHSIDTTPSKSMNGDKERSVKHHTSYSNLLNGIIKDSDESRYSKTNGCSQNGHFLNGRTTDGEEYSDGGYKSLPPTINLVSHNKTSGIPRRTVNNSEIRFSSAKQAQTNKC